MFSVFVVNFSDASIGQYASFHSSVDCHGLVKDWRMTSVFRLLLGRKTYKHYNINYNIIYSVYNIIHTIISAGPPLGSIAWHGTLVPPAREVRDRQLCKSFILAKSKNKTLTNVQDLLYCYCALTSSLRYANAINWPLFDLHICKLKINIVTSQYWIFYLISHNKSKFYLLFFLMFVNSWSQLLY